MRNVAISIWIAAMALPVLAQAPPRGRLPRPTMSVEALEAAVKQAAEQLAVVRRICERDVAVLRHLRVADGALTDPMQPAIAVQKAYEEVVAAKRLNPDFVVMQGTIRTERELESARRSAGTADFGHLRSILRAEAVGPASRVVIRNALRLEEEAAAWLRIQQLIGEHLRALSEISSQSLRAFEE